MSRGKRFKAEQIVHKLREADVLIGQGLAVPEVIRRLEVTHRFPYSLLRTLSILFASRVVPERHHPRDDSNELSGL